MNRMPVSQTDKDPVFSCSNLRIVSFSTCEIIMSIEKVNSIFLKDGSHSKSFYAESGIRNSNLSTKLVDLS